MTLIEKLKQGPGSRELSDEVLLALGWTRKLRGWLAPERLFWYNAPNPTLSVDDALGLRSGKWPIMQEMAFGWQVDIHDHVAKAPTLTLALSAAIVKAEVRHD